MKAFGRARVQDPARELRAALEGRSILCVSDDRYVLGMRKQLLKAFGCFVLTADGTRAIAVLKDHTVDAMVLDCRSPATDAGLWAINLRMARPQAPLLMVGKDPVAVSDSLKKIVSLVLPGNVSSAALLQALASCLQHRRARALFLGRAAG